MKMSYEVNYVSFFQDQEISKGLVFRTSNLDLALKKASEASRKYSGHKVFKGEIKKSSLENTPHYGVFLYLGKCNDVEIEIYLKEHKCTT
jgi:hypothetical protein